ncbi:hypothetical protein [Maritalea porphyrae]|uniref:hypothetical protein n=1 Tax=Maritalea porphyrae TaxID=880732 RepID=UPI0022B05F4E|nr:hypothetical protein [Maritalea porphyrae]MCZ4270730.1 hypothetical protein [Maritalea porphyrae]
MNEPKKEKICLRVVRQPGHQMLATIQVGENTIDNSALLDVRYDRDKVAIVLDASKVDVQVTCIDPDD